jgi:NTP pyrophosphatase (non-canonical NTP hydrolase)
MTPVGPGTSILSVLEKVEAERRRQELIAAGGGIAWSCADVMISPDLKLAVLTEEVGEVARAVLGEAGAVRDGGDLATELIHVAAVAVAWAESLATKDPA